MGKCLVLVLALVLVLCSHTHSQLYHDAIEVLPANVHDKDFETVAPTYQPTGTRSDSNLVCLGKPLLDELENLKLFMVSIPKHLHSDSHQHLRFP